MVDKGNNEKEDEIFEIEDMSTNGTYLNGEKLEKGKKFRIYNGDEIGVIVLIEDDKKIIRLGYKFRDTH